MNRREYEEKQLAAAREAFKHHEIIATTESSWTLHGGTSFGDVTVGVLHGYLIVVGDNDTCVFAGSHSYVAFPRQMVAAIGNSHSLVYAKTKAIGGGMGALAEEDDTAVALADIADLRGNYAALSNILDEATEAVENGDIGEARLILRDSGLIETAAACDIGSVTSLRVIFAYAIVERLWTLLSKL